MTEPWKQEQTCKDVFERPAMSRVFLTDNHRIGVLNPPGDVATYSTAEAQALQQTLWNAVLEAIRRGAE
ncbi:MAG: hypothetical protein WBA97_01115 [Actinophytocola sp.]|uniref:hypothetical protein n=1 Tax=Actinophytocola sp. TaxID=1872138 RepID=UPI003C710A14